MSMGNSEKTSRESQMEETLQGIFGYESFRPGQKETITAALDGRDVLVTMQTGKGKSLCYEMPAAIKGKTTVVVSPLIALMRDQAQRMEKKGVAAVDFHSGRPDDERKRIMGQIQQRVYTLLYVSPEQLKNKQFEEAIRAADVARVVVDEAHCISTWGHDFRPEYLEINDFAERNGVRQKMALTATATTKVKDEIRKSLKLQDPFEYHGDLYRENLNYGIVTLKDTKARKKTIADLINTIAPGEDEAVIVYCSTRKDVEDIAANLRKRNIPAVFYHAGLADEERREVEESFLTNKTRVMVATNAFGMGIDKPNVRLVLHHKMPGSVQAYLQETGRAGRDGKTAFCILLYHESDTNIQEHFIFEKTPGPKFTRSVYEAIGRQYERSRQKVPGGWFPLNRIGLYESFTTGESKAERSRDTLVNAAIDYMVEHKIIELKATYVKLNAFPTGGESEEALQKAIEDRKQIAIANLDQIVRYATDKNADQRSLLNLMEE